MHGKGINYVNKLKDRDFFCCYGHGCGVVMVTVVVVRFTV